MAGEVAQIADGRRARGERSRAAIVQAVVDLLPESEGMPSTTKVAERAGVTQRTLFRHFGSVDDLLAAVIEEQAEVIAPYLARLDDGGPRADRIARIVAKRAELFARIATVRRWALQLRATYPDIANGLRRAAVAQQRPDQPPLRGRARRDGRRAAGSARSTPSTSPSRGRRGIDSSTSSSSTTTRWWRCWPRSWPASSATTTSSRRGSTQGEAHDGSGVRRHGRSVHGRSRRPGGRRSSNGPRAPPT